MFINPRLGGKFHFDGHYADFLKFFAIDTEDTYHGEQSVRMVAGEAPEAPISNGVGTHNVNVAAGTPVTFSVYLKASEDDFPVTLSLWEVYHRNHATNIVVSREWRRYSFTLREPERARVRESVTFSRPGTLWADAVQVEIGAKASPFMPSPLDKDKFRDDKDADPAIPEDLPLVFLPDPPVIDGVLEDVWRDRLRVQVPPGPVHRSEPGRALGTEHRPP